MDEKKELTSILCSHLLLSGKKIGKKESKILSESISKFYVKEKSDIYFSGNAGILYTKAKNLSWKLNEQKGQSKKRKMQHDEDNVETFNEDEHESDAYVRRYFKEKDATFLHHWKKSLALRNYTFQTARKEGHNISSIYSVFAENNGFEMVSNLFEFFCNFSQPLIFFSNFRSILILTYYTILADSIQNGLR